MGRPPRAGKRSGERIEIRVTSNELAAWRRAAARAGQTLSDWIRDGCNGRAR